MSSTPAHRTATNELSQPRRSALALRLLGAAGSTDARTQTLSEGAEPGPGRDEPRFSVLALRLQAEAKRERESALAPEQSQQAPSRSGVHVRVDTKLPREAARPAAGRKRAAR